MYLAWRVQDTVFDAVLLAVQLILSLSTFFLQISSCPEIPVIRHQKRSPPNCHVFRWLLSCHLYYYLHHLPLCAYQILWSKTLQFGENCTCKLTAKESENNQEMKIPLEEQEGGGNVLRTNWEKRPINPFINSWTSCSFSLWWPKTRCYRWTGSARLSLWSIFGIATKLCICACAEKGKASGPNRNCVLQEGIRRGLLSNAERWHQSRPKSAVKCQTNSVQRGQNPIFQDTEVWSKKG